MYSISPTMNESMYEYLFDSDHLDQLNNIYEFDKTLPYFKSYQKVLLVILFCLIFVLSMVGNSLVLFIFCRRKRMKTVNNFFVINITLSNLIYTLCAPFPLIIEINDQAGEWIFSDFLCSLIPVLNTISINQNTMTMMASAIDKLIGIVCPFKQKLSKKKCLIILAIIWTLSISFGLPWLFLIQVTNESIYIGGDNFASQDSKATIKLCLPTAQTNDQMIRTFFISQSFLEYFLPLIVLIITYSIILFHVNVTNAKNIRNDANKSNIRLRKKNEKKVKIF